MAWTAPKTWTAEVLTSSDMNTYIRDNQLFLKANTSYGAASSLTVSSGEITVTQSYHKVAGEGAAADDIDTISGGTEGQVITIRPNGQIITLKNGTGNLTLGRDVILKTDNYHISLIYTADNVWVPAVLLPGRAYAGAYLFENSTALSIQEANTIHAIHGWTQGHLSTGWTFFAGVVCTITAYATSDSGTKTKVSSNAAGLTNGDIVTIANTAHYDGVYVIEQVVASTSFVIPKAYDSDDGASVGHAAGYLTNTASTSTGVYLVTDVVSATPATSGETFEFKFYLDTTAQNNTTSQIKLGTAADYAIASATGIIEYTAGQKLWVSVTNLSGAHNITCRHGNMTLTSLL